MARENMQLEDWLDDLCVRFIINLPEEDLSSVARICFQIEEAQWFYEDFIRPLDPTLPSMSLRNFSLRIFQHCPLLAPFSVENHTRAFEEFLQYKTRVPVRGAILLNEAMDSTVLVKGWKKGANWSFPRGKINKDEDDLECAIREVYEETGYDLHAAGLVPKNRKVKYIEITMREQQMRLYVFRDVPMETQFAPRTRKEISKIQWYNLSELPAFRKKGNNQNHNNVAAAANANKFYMVAPFLVPLKKWVVQQKKKEAPRSGQETQSHPHQAFDEPITEDDSWARSNVPNTMPEPLLPNKGNPGLDTIEGVTKELQRLLKVQPAAQPAAAPATEANSDKGVSLLALLQATSRPSEHPTGSQAPPGHTINQAPSPKAHSNQHPQQRAPVEGYQPLPPFPVQQPQFQQPWGPQPGQLPPYQQPIMAAPAVKDTQPPLRHPQPLPPQIMIDQGKFLNAPSSSSFRGGHDGPAGDASTHQVHSNDHNPPQNVPPYPRQAPKQLTNQSLALLDVLRSSNKPQETTQASEPTQPQSFQSGESAGHSAQGVDIGGSKPAQHANSSAWNQNIPHHMHQGGGVSQQQRSTLLQMFKQPATKPAPKVEAAPSSGEMLLKQRLTTTSSSNGNSSPVAAVSRPENRTELPTDEVAIHPRPEITPNAPIGSQQRRPSQPAHVQQTTLPQVAQRIPAQAPARTHTALQHAKNAERTPARRPVPLDPAVAAPYRPEDKPSSLASPPATSSFPTPSALQRKQSMSNDQKQKLLSLFGSKPQSTSPASSMAERPRELPSHGPSPRSGAASVASVPPGQHGPRGGSVAETRKSSQTPISPADRSFLLSYLASATSNTQ